MKKKPMKNEQAKPAKKDKNDDAKMIKEYVKNKK